MCCLVSMFLPVVSLEARLTYKQVLFWVSRRSGGARSFAASPLAFAAPPLAFVAPPFVRETPGGGGGGTPLYGLNGDVLPDRVWFSGQSCPKRGNDFITFCLKQGILIFKREARTLKFVKMAQKAELVPFLLALMPEACATTKLDKDFWLNVLRPGLKKLHAVLNRVGKSENFVFNRQKIGFFCLKQSQGLSAPAASPYPNIR